MPRTSTLAPGLYDQPITQALDHELQQLAAKLYKQEPLDPGAAHLTLARLLDRLELMTNEGDRVFDMHRRV